ncbi:MAG TPA: hypothetical protein VLQ68_00060 [Rhizobiaceae bacterium]|nr:hypothetical protein [Rhizobiaceae bacterium]
MEQIEQLKAMRDAAKARLEATPDYRLMTSLAALIDDLEAAFSGEPLAPAEPQAAEPQAAKPEAVEAAPEPEVAQEQQAEDVTPVETDYEETVVIAEIDEEIDPGQISFDEIELDITPEDIDAEELETGMAAEVLSMNGDAVAGSLSETAEEAVNRALDELSIDLADELEAETATRGRR